VLRLNRVTNTLVSPLRIFLHLVRAPRYLAGSPAGISRISQGSAGISPELTYRSLGRFRKPVNGPPTGGMTPPTARRSA
jgi:hypothetical protein